MEHAVLLAYAEQQDQDVQNVNRRRAVSAAYYALFHRLSGDAAALLAPNVSLETRYRIQRWFDHAEMKRICIRFLPTSLQEPLHSLIGASASTDLRFVARTFIQLQEARHKADYDLASSFSSDAVGELLETALKSLQAFTRLQASSEANIFLLSLLLWRNWERDRPA